MNELVSIITPTFNRAHSIDTAIKSVLAKTYQNWEMRIIDDGGTDDTRKVIAAFNDPRLVYERMPHGGQSKARNYGLTVARGEFITFLDSDNDFLPMFLERLVETFNAHPDVLCIVVREHKTHELWKNGALVKSVEITDAFPESSNDIAKDFVHRRFIFDMNGFSHRASIRDEGIRFDEQLSRMEDWDYGMAIAAIYPTRFFYLAEPLLNYHQRYGSDGLVSKTSYGDWADTFETIYQKHKNDPLMQGQAWYPDRVEKWRKIQADYERGIVPPQEQYFFEKGE